MTHSQALETVAAERYLLDEMSELERHAFENHYFDCVECAADVRAGALVREGVQAGLMGSLGSVVAEASVVGSGFSWIGQDANGQDAAMKARRWKPSVVLPWAVAATLAMAIGYQSSFVAPRSAFQPQALNPITIRAASRGAEAVVTVGSGSAFVTLAVELNASADELVYNLRSADDRTVASGRVQAPAPGAPLFLLVPASTLTPGERYSLAVRHAATIELIGEFRFGVTAQ